MVAKCIDKILRFVQKHAICVFEGMLCIFIISLFMDAFDNWIWRIADATITIFTLLLVYVDYESRQKELEKVAIAFECKETKERYCLNVNIMRKDISRSEIMGIIGVFRKEQEKPYSIKSLAEINFFNHIYEVQNDSKDELTIQLTANELALFDTTKMTKDETYSAKV